MLNRIFAILAMFFVACSAYTSWERLDNSTKMYAFFIVLSIYFVHCFYLDLKIEKLKKLLCKKAEKNK